MLKRNWIFLLGFLLLQLSVYAQTPSAKVKELIKGEYYKEAKAEAAKLIASDPGNPENYYWSGMAYYGLEDYVGAKAEFQKGVKARNKYALNHVGTARVMQQEGKNDDAVKLFDKALELSKGEDINVLIEMAYGYLEAAEKIKGNKNYEARMAKVKQAEVYLLKAQNKDKTNVETAIALGRMYLKKGIKELAKNQFNNATTINPKFVEGYYELAKMDVNEGRELYDVALSTDNKAKKEEANKLFKSGIELYGKAIAADANFAPAYRERGEVYQLYNQYQLARDDYKKYLELTKNDTRAKVLYVKFLYLCGNYQETIDEINKITDTTTVLMRRLKGYSYFKTGQYEEAKKAMADYFANTKEDFQMYEDYELYGRTFKQLGDLAGAEAQFMKAIKMDSTRLGVLDTLSDHYDKIKDYKNQARILQKSIDLRKSTDYRDFYYLGIAHYYAKDSVSAEKAFTEAIKGNDAYEPSHYWLANSLKKQKKLAEAAVEYEKVMTLLEAKPKDTRKKSENDHLAYATQFVAGYYLDPDKDGANFDCAKAKPYLVKLSALIDFEAADNAYWKAAMQQCP